MRNCMSTALPAAILNKEIFFFRLPAVAVGTPTPPPPSTADTKKRYIHFMPNVLFHHQNNKTKDS